MKPTVKMLVSGMAMCFVAPAAFATSTEQAATNLLGAAQFSHLARKSYSTALQNERITGQAMYAAFFLNTAFIPLKLKQPFRHTPMPLIGSRLHALRTNSAERNWTPRVWH